jgi:putative isomerase
MASGLRLHLTAVLLLLGCSSPPPQRSWTPEDFPNLLDLRGPPEGPRDLTAFAFSDLGAWHMYGLPDAEGATSPGTFPGPLLLHDGGVWLSPSLFGPELSVQGEMLVLEWDTEALSPVSYLPGLLRQEVVAGPLGVRLELAFASPGTALVRAEIRNRGDQAVEVEWGWGGGPFLLDADVVVREGGAVIRIIDSGTRVLLTPLGDSEVLSVTDEGVNRYLLKAAPISLSPGETTTRYLKVSVLAEDQEESVEVWRGGAGRPGKPGAPGEPEAVFFEGEARWAGYLEAVLEPRGEGREPVARDRVAVKAVQTLVSNWRAPWGHLYHAGLFPSYAYRGFHGVWSWDSWKHARALALFAPELAKDQMRVMLDYQDQAGMVPDVIYADSMENNWRDTKPPLASWAVHGIFQATADTSFVEEVLPSLLRYHEWWYTDRDHDGNGLCEYGSTDGTRIAAAWESGMDNAVRFDDAIMVQNSPTAWSLNQESVDLNAYLFAEKGYLAELLDVVGKEEEAREFRASAEGLKELMRETFYHGASGYFYDVRLDSKAPIVVEGPEGWIPLWTGVATEEQAARVVSVMMDPSKFSGTVPLPTLSMDHPEFDPSNGYWRGPVWLDQAYFGIQGLWAYGFQEEARELSRRLVEASEGLLGDGPIFENYHPQTGEGLNAAHFSWSAAHLLMLATEGFMAWDEGLERD